MFNYITLKAQLASIMGILSEAAVADMIKVVEESSTIFSVEMSRCQEENEELKRKLHCMECEFKTMWQSMRKTDTTEKPYYTCSVGVQTSSEMWRIEKEEEACPSVDGDFEKDWCQNLWNGGEPPGGDKEYTALVHGSTRAQYAKIEEEFEGPENNFASERLEENEESVKLQEVTAGYHAPSEIHPCGESNTHSEPVAGPAEPQIKFTPENSEVDSDTDYTKGHFVLSGNFEVPCKTKPDTELGKETQFICNPCGRNFGQFEGHFSSHSAGGQFFGTECLKSVSAAQQFEMHKCDYTGEKSVTSVACGKDCNQRSNLSMQEHVHSKTKPYKCNVCGKGFTQRKSLVRHKTVHNESGISVFTCMACGKNFTSKRYLKAHEFLHTGKKPFSCTVCGRTFSHKCNLYSHLRTHTGEKPFQCNECGKRFTQLGHLKRHRFVHSADKCV